MAETHSNLEGIPDVVRTQDFDGRTRTDAIQVSTEERTRLGASAEAIVSHLAADLEGISVPLCERRNKPSLGVDGSEHPTRKANRKRNCL